MIILECVVVKFKLRSNTACHPDMPKSHFTTPKKPLFDTQKATLKNADFRRFYDRLSSVLAVSVRYIISFLRREVLLSPDSSTDQFFETL